MHFDYAQYKQKGFAPILILVGILIMVAVAGGAYYFGTLKNNPQTQQTQNPVVVSQSPQSTITQSSSPDGTANPSKEELSGFPVYPNATFEGKQSAVPCTNGAEENGFSTCNAVVYSWKTPDDWDKVTSWYRQTGWICGGAGTYTSPRDASSGGNTCTKNNRRFGTFFDATAQETTIDFALYP